jgi:hypothetical protein
MMDVPDRSGEALPGVPGLTVGCECCLYHRQLAEAFVMCWQNVILIDPAQSTLCSLVRQIVFAALSWLLDWQTPECVLHGCSFDESIKNHQN